MTRGKRNTAWLALVLYAVTVCAGEGLHLLPGCGHAAQACVPGDRDAARPMRAAHDADGCPICKLGLLPGCASAAATLVVAEVTVGHVVRASEPDTTRHVGSSFLSRAPPTA